MVQVRCGVVLARKGMAHCMTATSFTRLLLFLLASLLSSAEAFSGIVLSKMSQDQKKSATSAPFLDNTGGLWHAAKRVPLPPERLRLVRSLIEKLPAFSVTVGEV